MRLLRNLLRNLFHQDRREHDLDDELRAYEDLLASEKRDAGLDEPEARRAARMEIGASITQLKEQVREVHMSFLFESIWRDLCLSARALRRRPGFALTVIAVLALGIGGTSAIFSIYYSLHVRALPFPDPDRLVNLDEAAPQWDLERTGVAYADFAAWRERNRSFEAMAVAARGEATVITGDTGAELAPAARATHDLPDVLRVQPAIGRWFTRAEDIPNGPKLVVVSHGFWQKYLGSDPRAAGRKLRIDAELREVIGVMPPGFDFPDRTEIWSPLGLSAADGGGWFLTGVARLKNGVTAKAALEDLTRIHRAMIPERKQNAITSPSIYSLREWYVGRYLSPARVLLGAVGLLLLIACANAAGIVLARASGRTREVSMLTALGAPRLRIVRQLLTESVLLALAGGVLGVLIGTAGLSLLVRLLPANRIPVWVRFDWDWRFLAFALILSFASALLFGLWPAWTASRTDLRSAIQGGLRASETPARRRGLQALIVAEVSLALILLAAAALLGQAFRQIERTSPGFRPGQILTYSVNLPATKYPKPGQQVAFFDDLVRQTRQLPGVRNAAVTSATPLGGHSGTFYEVEGAPPRRPGENDPVVLRRLVSAGYLEAMGMTLLGGRTFTDSDGRSQGTETAIVNETFAKLAWPGQSFAGKRIRERGEKRWWPVAGVIADVRDYGLDEPSRPSVYVPLPQAPRRGMSMTVQTSFSDPSTLTNAARDVLRRIDPDIAMVRPSTMETRLHDSMWIRRVYSFLVVSFAVLALILAGGGLFGVISYTVGQRNREIAIRMALGAQRSGIRNGVLREALGIAGIGVLLGTLASIGLIRVARSLEFESLLAGIDPHDPFTYAACAALLSLLALGASLLPAARAASVPPASALRMD